MSTPSSDDDFIEIRPSSNVFATYRRLSYKPWYAVAEFVDNSTQSFFDNEDELTGVSETLTPLEVRIYHDKAAATLTVADNARGMNLSDFKRAVQLNSPPSGKKTRNEFGMGLKTAACWMGSRWTVRTKELGSSLEYSTTVDVNELATVAPERLPITTVEGLDPRDHYTVVHVEGMYRVFQTKTTGRIKELLGSMYRRDLASLKIGIYWNDEALQWTADPVFSERLPDGSAITWRNQFDLKLPSGRSARGWAAIRLPGNARRAGLHLLREGRIVLGGPGQGWKPGEIYGAPNSFASQRLVGEIDLDGWPVTQAKDGFDWDGGLEEELIQALEPELRPLVDKASGTLKDPTMPVGTEPSSASAALAVDTIASEVSADSVGSTVEFFEEEPLLGEATVEEQQELVAAAEATGMEPNLTQIGTDGTPTVKWWLLDKEHPAEAFMRLAMPTPHELHIFVNLRHQFVEEHIGGDQALLVLYLKFLLADALVDRAVTRRVGPTNQTTMRKFKDTFLRNLPPQVG